MGKYDANRMASEDPRSLFRELDYWLLKNRSFVYLSAFAIFAIALMVLTGIISFWGLWYWISFRWTRSESISLLIQAIICVTTALTLRKAFLLCAQIDVDSACAELVSRECGKQISKIKGSNSYVIEIDKVKESWPDNPSAELVTMNLCNAIHSDAVDSQFGNKESILDYYRESYQAAIFSIHSMQKTVLHIGILGTFIGLFFAMPSLMNISQGTNLSSFSGLFKNLGVCFSTSITGLIGAVIIGAVSFLLIEKEEKFFSRLDKLTSRLLVVVRNALNRGAMARTFDQMQIAMADLVGTMTQLNERITVQTDAFDDGVKQLTAVKGNVEDFMSATSTLKQFVVKEIESVSESIKSNKVGELVDERSLQILNAQADRLAKSVEKIASNADSSSKSLREATAMLQAKEQNLLAAMEKDAEIRKQNESEVFSWHEEAQTFVASLQNAVELLTTELSSQKEQREQNNGVLGSSETVDVLRDLLSQMDSRFESQSSDFKKDLNNFLVGLFKQQKKVEEDISTFIDELRKPKTDSSGERDTDFESVVKRLSVLVARNSRDTATLNDSLASLVTLLESLPSTLGKEVREGMKRRLHVLPPATEQAINSSRVKEQTFFERLLRRSPK